MECLFLNTLLIISLIVSSAFHNRERNRRDACAPSRKIILRFGVTVGTSAGSPDRPRIRSPLSTSSDAASTHNNSTLFNTAVVIAWSPLQMRWMRFVVAVLMAMCPVPKWLATPTTPVLVTKSEEQQENLNNKRCLRSSLMRAMVAAESKASFVSSRTALSKQSTNDLLRASRLSPVSLPSVKACHVDLNSSTVGQILSAMGLPMPSTSKDKAMNTLWRCLVV